MNFRAFILALLLLVLCSCEKEHINHSFKIIAHRGYWKMADGADNSILGLEEAARLGVDGVEIDVCKTIDDSLLVVHGLYHGEYHIPTTDYATIRTVRVSNGELVPTLNEYLQEAIKYNLLYYIELKTPNEENDVLKILDRYDYRYKVRLCSFSATICETLIGLDSKLNVSYINGDKTPAELLQKGYRGLHYDVAVLKEHTDWIKECNSLGLDISAWVIKTESDIIWCSTHNVENLIVDNPLETIQFRALYE